MQVSMDINQDIAAETRRVALPFTIAHIFYSNFIELTKQLVLVDTKNAIQEDALQEYFNVLKDCAWLFFVILSKVILTEGSLNDKFGNRIPANANALLAMISLVLTESNSELDLHIIQLSEGEKVSIVIPGSTKQQMETQVQEYLARLMGFEFDSNIELQIKQQA